MSDDEGSNAGYSFIGLVISAGIVGFVIDKFLPTQPWGLIGFMCIGIIYATYKAQKIMNPPQSNFDDRGKDTSDNKKE